MRFGIAALLLLGVSGCQTYKYAHQVKLIAFRDNIEQGESVGNVTAKDCQSAIMGLVTGPEVTLDRAMEKVQNKKENSVRYLNDVSTENEGFDAYFYRKSCLLVKGRGYQ